MSKIRCPIVPTAALVFCALVGGCSRKADDVNVDCSKLAPEFFTGHRVFSAFPGMPLDEKYRAYICGMQTIRPPLIALAPLFANEGRNAVPFLMDKLQETRSDVTVRDILLVLLEMQINNSYSVAKNDEVMTQLAKRIEALDSASARDRGRVVLAQIRSAR